jgi:hypothetical protein
MSANSTAARALGRRRQVGHAREHRLVALGHQREDAGGQQRRVDQDGAQRRAVGAAQRDPEQAHRPPPRADLQVDREDPQR